MKISPKASEKKISTSIRINLNNVLKPQTQHVEMTKSTRCLFGKDSSCIDIHKKSVFAIQRVGFAI